MSLIPAFQKDEALRHHILQTATKIEGFRVWWLGQSGFLLQWQSKHLLFDPYLSDSLTLKYARTDKPHVRMSECAIAPALLDMVQVVTSSHNHTDHLDADTLQPLIEANPSLQMIIPEANRTFVAQRLGCEANWPIGLDAGQTIEIEGFKIHGIPAAHNTIEYDEVGRCRYMGFVVTFGQYAVYHSGDTLWYEGLEKWLQPFELDIAFLPINGHKPERRVAGNLNAEEAARLGKKIGAMCVVPHHYDMFTFNTEDPSTFIFFALLYQTPYRILRIGESMAID
ncbi:MAG: MBL fold metallo-hydrolase [Runella sp.]